MHVNQFIIAGLMSSLCVAVPTTYWVHSSCQDPRFHGSFEIALKDALFTAKRALMRLEAPVGPYMDEIFQLLFRKPKSDVATFNRVKYIFEVLGTQMVRTENQLTSDIRIYCDGDAYGPGNRWTITPNDPSDPVYVKNDRLPRELPAGQPKDTPLQQWQDETNWIRMSRGSMGCKSTEATAAETQHRKFTAENTPRGINPERVTFTICDHRLTDTELAGSENTQSATSFKSYDLWTSTQEPILNMMPLMNFALSMEILHEFTHMDKEGFRLDDAAYGWKAAVLLSAEDAIRNAETYAFYAWLARCADKGYRLKMDGQNDEAKLLTIEKGDVLYDENLERVGGE
ncbi:hypothetical protein GQ44DRAFT_98932 [Phaeosphaeriaceae sp. PMI808]|nr:hypothetical protein GQ44DRAFT_98932 [Phaeosphaeriaceae sp. PMI808]